MRIRSTPVFTVLRLLAFLVPFGVMMLFPILREYYWLAAIFAALIGLSLSVLFLRRPLSEMASDIDSRRAARTRRTVAEDDAAAEDAATDQG